MRALDVLLALIPLAAALAVTLAIRSLRRRRRDRHARKWMEPAMNRLGYLMVPRVCNEHPYDPRPQWPCAECGALHGRGLHQRCEGCK